jgi:hypothetical protein
MPAVNWDQPSQGGVSDPQPALELKNDQGGALLARSESVAVEAESKSSNALRARTDTTLTASLRSEQNAALLALAPKSIAAMAGNNAAAVAAGGLNLTDPAIPNVINNPDGIGVAGITTRFRATGVAGAALGPRSVGVFGRADSGVGVHGVGSSGGVQGESADGSGVQGTSFAKNAAGVTGVGASATAIGVRAHSIGSPGVEATSAAGPGMRAASQQAEGVLAEATAANAAGVRAMNDHASGIGVDASSQKGIALRGLTTSGTAIYAESLTGPGIDVSNFSQNHPAIDAYAPAAVAVDAKSWTAPGVTTFGKTGVEATALSPPDPDDPPVGAAVFGGTIAGNSVYGMTTAGIGVVGTGLEVAGGWAGAFYGRVLVNGTIYKQCCQFSIDHPLDPENRVLNHVSVEAPEHKTFYDGVVTLNAQGRASVRLPRWFDALNAPDSLRYQLTPLGASAPELHVAQGMENGAFIIAGGRAGQQVCWQVTGVRRDEYARAHPVVVEQRKRDVRPSPPAPSVDQVTRFGRDLEARGKQIKRELDRRERLARARTLPGPLSPVAASVAAHETDAVNRLIDQMLALGRRHMPSEPVAGSSARRTSRTKQAKSRGRS